MFQKFYSKKNYFKIVNLKILKILFEKVYFGINNPEVNFAKMK